MRFYLIIFLKSLITVSILFLMFEISVEIEFLNPVTATFNDLNFNDIISSKLKPFELNPLDSNIVILNLPKTRDEIISQINTLQKYKPKVIALDMIIKSNDWNKDTLFLEKLIKHNNLIIGFSLNELIKEKLNYIYLLNKYKNNIGFTDLLVTNNQKTIRSYFPFYSLSNLKLLSFTSAIINKYSPEKYSVLLKRNNEIEYINYDAKKLFYYFELNDKTNIKDENIIKNKIVLIGYLESDCVENSVDCTDKFFTPLNSRYIGRSLPDMYGVVIHANILSTIINNKFYYNLSKFETYFFLFILIILNYSIFATLNKEYKLLINIIMIFEIFFIFFTYALINIYYLVYLDIKIYILSIILSHSFFNFLNKIFFNLRRNLYETKNFVFNIDNYYY